MTYTTILSAIIKFWLYSGIGENWFRWLYYSSPYIFNFWQLICPFSWSCFLHWSVLLYTIISVYKWVHTDSNICFLFLFFSNLKQQFFLSSKICNLRTQQRAGFVCSVHGVSWGSLPEGCRIHSQWALCLAGQCELSAGCRGVETPLHVGLSVCGPGFLTAVNWVPRGASHERNG